MEAKSDRGGNVPVGQPESGARRAERLRPSAITGWCAVLVAIAVIPGATWFSESPDFWVSFGKWPLLVVGLAGWSVAARRWERVDKALKLILPFYVILALSFVFVAR